MSHPNDLRYRDRYILGAARQWHVDPSTLYGLGVIESGWRPNLTSRAGAQGWMQFMPGTASSLGVNPNDLHSSIYGAAHYLSQLGYESDPRLALAKYNAGPGNPGAAGTYPSDVLDAAKGWKGGSVRSSPTGGSDGLNLLPVGQNSSSTPKLNPIEVIANLNSLSSKPDDPSQQNLNLLSELVAQRDQSQATSGGVAPLSLFGSSTGDQSSSGGGGSVSRMFSTAQAFDKAHTVYLWGGGHGGIASPADRVDCSGYVSSILHAAGLLNAPLTSGQLAGWGDAGTGHHVTVYANGGHTFIEINGRFFGTSHSNPGGGPGEIPRPSTTYLRQFTARHPRGL